MLRPTFAAALAISATLTASAASDLPTVTIMGKTFYTYVAKKGESFFGIANRFGWDPELLVKTNRELETPLDKGALIYYPVPKKPKTSKVNQKSSAAEVLASDSSDTREAFADLDDSTSDHYDTKPSDPSEAGSYVSDITAADVSGSPAASDPATSGDEEQGADIIRDGVLYHTVQPGESLYGIAQTYETTVEDLYKMNPGISYSNPNTGEIIRIRTGSRNESAVPTMVTEHQVTGVASYKVRHLGFRGAGKRS